MIVLALKLVRELIRISLAAVLAWSFVPATWAQDKMRVSYSAISSNSAVMWIALEQGFYKKYGLDVEMLFIESGTLTSQALAAGEIGVAHNAGAPAIISAAAGSGEVLIMGLVNSLDYSLVSTPLLKTMEDLKGKRIGVSRIGSSSHAAVAVALDHFKMDPKRDGITFFQSGTTTSRVSALKAGSIDATVVDPPLVSMLKVEGFRELSYLGGLGIPYQHAALVANRLYMQKNRDKVLKAVKALVDTNAFIVEDRNSGEIKKVLAKYLKLNDAAKLEDLYKGVKSNTQKVKKPYPTVEGVNALIRFLGRFNPAVAKMNTSDIINSSFVEELDKNGFIDAVYAQADKRR